MKYNTLKLNDIANGPGIAVSVYLQGCPHHCYNCFNQESWDFEGGKEFTPETMQEIVNGLCENGVKRSLCILGGEPLVPCNQFLTNMIIQEVRARVPDTKIFVWTGYVLENLKKDAASPHLQSILESIDVLVDGPYVDSLRDMRLYMRGSSNQRVIDMQETIEKGEIVIWNGVAQ